MPEEKEEGQQPAAVNPPDVHADLDDEAQVDDDNNGPGVMKELLRAVHERLKKETHKDFTEERWLLGIFNSNDWWLRVERLEVDKVFERLDIQPSLMEYYRDINLWLPDLRWGAMPPCPCCSSAKSVRFHCWRDNHFGRRIIGLDTNYYVISRRYICGECESNSKQAKKAAMVAAESAGLIVLGDVDDAADVGQHTFTGWDERSRSLLPHGLGSHFPVFLT